MSLELNDFYEKCSPLIAQALGRAVGQPPAAARDEAQFRRLVSDPAWEALPLPVRKLGREAVQWDRFLFEVRKSVYRVEAGKLALRDGAGAAVTTLARQMFGQPTAAPPPSPSAAAAGEVAVGIDLGTTYSVVAYVDGHGRPCTIHNNAGDLTTPSVILLDDDGPVVGKQAVLAAPLEPDRVAVCVKRDMGQKFYHRPVNGQNFPPEVLSSFILRSLKQDAERRLGTARKAVITVPAYFDEARRSATLDAGRLAGLEVLDILNEPTAAAIAYGYQVGFLEKGTAGAAGDGPLRVLVYDLGGGTFDVTVLEIRGTAFTALATDGDARLGGRDWDEKLVGLAAERLLASTGADPRDHPTTREELWLAAEGAKRALSERQKATMVVAHQGTRHKVEVARAEFEEATAGLLERTRATTEIVLRQAGLRWADVARVLLVGGSTRMPMVARMLTELTGQEPERSVSPDEAVAHGAALYADLLLRRHTRPAERPAFSVTNVNSHSLGIVGLDPATGRRRNQVLIPKNTPLPHSATGTFKTSKAGQEAVRIRVVEGESERPEACSPVGVCQVAPLPRGLPAGWPVTVTYSYEANGRLRVTAQVKGQAGAVRTDFRRDNRMGAEEIARWSRYAAGRARG